MAAHQLATFVVIFRTDGGSRNEKQDGSQPRDCRGIEFADRASASSSVARPIQPARGTTAKQEQMNAVFVGVIVIAVIGNAAEHSTAVMMNSQKIGIYQSLTERSCASPRSKEGWLTAQAIQCHRKFLCVWKLICVIRWTIFCVLCSRCCGPPVQNVISDRS